MRASGVANAHVGPERHGRAAAHRVAVEGRDDGDVEPRHRRRHAARRFAVAGPVGAVGVEEVPERPRPVGEVRADAERVTGPGEDHGPDPRVGVAGGERLEERVREARGQRVAGRPVEDEGRDATVERDAHDAVLRPVTGCEQPFRARDGHR